MMNFKELGENLGLEEDEYRELVELFVDSGTAEFNRLKEAVTANNLDQIMRSAHTIKGAAGNLGLMDVHEEAKKIESSASSGQAEELAEAVQVMTGQFEAIAEFINAA